MLDFIGTGSAFNTSLGNNGAYIKKDNILFMIDCGSSTFERLMKSNILDGVEYIYVLLTHTHPDHIGSLGDLIFYSYYSMGEVAKSILTILTPKELNIRNILKPMGVNDECYFLWEFKKSIAVTQINGKFRLEFISVPVCHVEELSCFGYIIKYEGKTAYYSGDSNEIPLKIIDDLYNGEFDFFYQDTCKADYKGNVHLSLRKLNELIHEDFRNKVYCMHLDKAFVRKEAEDMGFNVVEIKG